LEPRGASAGNRKTGPPDVLHLGRGCEPRGGERAQRVAKIAAVELIATCLPLSVITMPILERSRSGLCQPPVAKPYEI